MDIKTEGDISAKTCITVNEHDEMTGIEDIAKCHTFPTIRHRAFSLFMFHGDKVLMQKRSKTKYTFPVAWTNTVCSHPRNENVSMEEWIKRRVQDEMGFDIDVNNLHFITKIAYSGQSDMQYGEDEIDHIYYMQVQSLPELSNINRDEIDEVGYCDDRTIQNMLGNEDYLVTPWFRAIYTFLKKENMTLLESMKTYQNSNTIHHLGDVGKATVQREHLLHVPLSYYMANPGKKIRSMCVHAVQEMYPELVDNHTRDLIANVVEHIHAASLLHDDIEDKSLTRRGMPCAHIMYGTARALNTGTFTMLKALRETYTISEHIGNMSMEMLMDLHRGQNADIFWAEHGVIPTEQEYIDMIRGKTGALIEYCASACVGTHDHPVVQYFIDLGKFFQIRDDYCNLCHEEYWNKKGFCEDLDEGKFGYPMIKYLDTGNASDWFIHKRKDDKVRAYLEMYNSGVLDDLYKDLVQSRESLIARNVNSKIMSMILDKLPVYEPPSEEKVREYHFK